jgi:hypothetical protein
MRFPWPGGFSSTVNEEVMMKRFSLPAPAFFFMRRRDKDPFGA